MLPEAEAEIRRFYGSHLITSSSAAIGDLEIEPTTARFLQTCGVPPIVTDGTELVITITPQLTVLTPRNHPTPCYRFGSSAFGQWVLEQTTGLIYLVDDDQQAHFINTHLAYLIVFCILYRTLHVEQPYATESARIYRHRAATVRRAFRHYDKRAVKQSMVWSDKLEEVGNGVV